MIDTIVIVNIHKSYNADYLYLCTYGKTVQHKKDFYYLSEYSGLFYNNGFIIST